MSNNYDINLVDFKVSINGKNLDVAELVDIYNIYERMTTAEFLYDNYDLSEEEALSFAEKVRELMDDYDYTEIEAIDKVVLNDIIRKE